MITLALAYPWSVDFERMLLNQHATLDIREFVCNYINRFGADVSKRIGKLL